MAAKSVESRRLEIAQAKRKATDVLFKQGVKYRKLLCEEDESTLPPINLWDSTLSTVATALNVIFHKYLTNEDAIAYLGKDSTSIDNFQDDMIRNAVPLGLMFYFRSKGWKQHGDYMFDTFYAEYVDILTDGYMIQNSKYIYPVSVCAELENFDKIEDLINRGHMPLMLTDRENRFYPDETSEVGDISPYAAEYAVTDYTLFNSLLPYVQTRTMFITLYYSILRNPDHEQELLDAAATTYVEKHKILGMANPLYLGYLFMDQKNALTALQTSVETSKSRVLKEFMYVVVLLSICNPDKFEALSPVFYVKALPLLADVGNVMFFDMVLNLALGDPSRAVSLKDVYASLGQNISIMGATRYDMNRATQGDKITSQKGETMLWNFIDKVKPPGFVKHGALQVLMINKIKSRTLNETWFVDRAEYMAVETYPDYYMVCSVMFCFNIDTLTYYNSYALQQASLAEPAQPLSVYVLIYQYLHSPLLLKLSVSYTPPPPPLLNTPDRRLKGLN